MEVIVPVLVLTLIVLTFGAALVFLTSLIGPKAEYSPIKNMPYECGLPGQEMDKSNVSVRYYLTAILFIIFDVEILY